MLPATLPFTQKNSAASPEISMLSVYLLAAIMQLTRRYSGSLWTGTSPAYHRDITGTSPEYPGSCLA